MQEGEKEMKLMTIILEIQNSNLKNPDNIFMEIPVKQNIQIEVNEQEVEE